MGVTPLHHLHGFPTLVPRSTNDTQVESTNVGDAISVRFNLASREAYSGDWGWVLGGVDPSLTLEDANSLTSDEANDAYEER